MLTAASCGSAALESLVSFPSLTSVPPLGVLATAVGASVAAAPLVAFFADVAFGAGAAAFLPAAVFDGAPDLGRAGFLAPAVPPATAMAPSPVSSAAGAAFLAEA